MPRQRGAFSLHFAFNHWIRNRVSNHNRQKDSNKYGHNTREDNHSTFAVIFLTKNEYILPEMLWLKTKVKKCNMNV